MLQVELEKAKKEYFNQGGRISYLNDGPGGSFEGEDFTAIPRLEFSKGFRSAGRSFVEPSAKIFIGSVI